jgi:hypothetical protein
MLGVGQALGVIAIDELVGTMEVYIVDDTDKVGISTVNELIEESELEEVDELDKTSVVEDDSRFEKVVGVEEVDSIELICDELRAVEEDDVVDAGSIAEENDEYVEVLVIIGELVIDDESDNIVEAEDVGSTVDILDNIKVAGKVGTTGPIDVEDVIKVEDIGIVDVWDFDVIKIDELDELITDGTGLVDRDGDDEGDDEESALQLPNPFWHPVPQ